MPLDKLEHAERVGQRGVGAHPRLPQLRSALAVGFTSGRRPGESAVEGRFWLPCCAGRIPHGLGVRLRAELLLLYNTNSTMNLVALVGEAEGTVNVLGLGIEQRASGVRLASGLARVRSRVGPRRQVVRGGVRIEAGEEAARSRVAEASVDDRGVRRRRRTAEPCWWDVVDQPAEQRDVAAGGSMRSA